MNEIEQQIKRVQDKLQQLLKQHQQLQKENDKLKQDLGQLKTNHQSQSEQIDQLRQQAEVLKLTKTNMDETEKKAFEKRLNQIRESYSRLNKHLRDVVHLRLEKHLSFPEIAKQMHTSVNNVTSWHSRAIKKLRKLNRK